jgi:hypothetical protein
VCTPPSFFPFLSPLTEPSLAAFVVLTPEAASRLEAGKTTEADLSKLICKHVTDHKIRYKALHPDVEFLEAIPKTPSGKLLRKDRTSFPFFPTPPPPRSLRSHTCLAINSTRPARSESGEVEDQVVEIELLASDTRTGEMETSCT